MKKRAPTVREWLRSKRDARDTPVQFTPLEKGIIESVVRLPRESEQAKEVQARIKEIQRKLGRS